MSRISTWASEQLRGPILQFKKNQDQMSYVAKCALKNMEKLEEFEKELQLKVTAVMDAKLQTQKLMRQCTIELKEKGAACSMLEVNLNKANSRIEQLEKLLQEENAKSGKLALENAYLRSALDENKGIVVCQEQDIIHLRETLRAHQTSTPLPIEAAPSTSTPLPNDAAPSTSTPLPNDAAPSTSTLLPIEAAPLTSTPLPNVAAPSTSTPLPIEAAPSTSTPLPNVAAPLTSTPLPNGAAPSTSTPLPNEAIPSISLAMGDIVSLISTSLDDIGEPATSTRIADDGGGHTDVAFVTPTHGILPFHLFSSTECYSPYPPSELPCPQSPHSPLMSIVNELLGIANVPSIELLRDKLIKYKEYDDGQILARQKHEEYIKAREAAKMLEGEWIESVQDTVNSRVNTLEQPAFFVMEEFVTSGRDVVVGGRGKKKKYNPNKYEREYKKRLLATNPG